MLRGCPRLLGFVDNSHLLLISSSRHTRVGDTGNVVQTLETAFYAVEDYRKPRDTMVTLEAALYDSNPRIKAMIDMRVNDNGGYRTYQEKKGDKMMYVVPIDMWIFAIRIKKAIKCLKDWGCPPVFEIRLGTQLDHQARAIALIRTFPLDDPVIILDPMGTFDVNGCNSTLCRTFSKFSLAIRSSRCAPQIMIVNSDQLGHRGMVCTCML